MEATLRFPHVPSPGEQSSYSYKNRKGKNIFLKQWEYSGRPNKRIRVTKKRSRKKRNETKGKMYTTHTQSLWMWKSFRYQREHFPIIILCP